MSTKTDAMSEEEKAMVGINAKTRFMGPELPGLRSWSGNRRRIKGPPGEGQYFHVMSRLTGDVPMWDALEKEAMVKLLWKMLAFCGVELLTYCVMGNHFHALVRVPDREGWLREKFGAAEVPGGTGAVTPSYVASADAAAREAPEAREKREEKFYGHLRTLYTKDYVATLRNGVAELRVKGRDEDAEKVLESFRRRFCEVSVWTKEVKERFSKWLNKRRERRGTLWMERFKSVLVEDGEALRTMALYIDLNPVRAGLVKEPADYRWSGYGAAAGGSVAEQAGLCAVVGDEKGTWGRAGEIYRGWLFTAGVETRGEDGQLARGGVSAEAAEVVMQAKGRIGAAQALGLRMKRMSDGMVLGSRAWVEEIYRAHRGRFGKKRKVGARPLGGKEAGLCTLRG